LKRTNLSHWFGVTDWLKDLKLLRFEREKLGWFCGYFFCLKISVFLMYEVKCMLCLSFSPYLIILLLFLDHLIWTHSFYHHQHDVANFERHVQWRSFNLKTHGIEHGMVHIYTLTLPYHCINNIYHDFVFIHSNLGISYIDFDCFGTL